MIYLLDTHFILWSLFEPEKITGDVRTILENDSDSKLISGVNLWEISLKYSLGKLALGGTNPSELFDFLLEAGFEAIDLDNRLFAATGATPDSVGIAPLINAQLDNPNRTRFDPSHR